MNLRVIPGTPRSVTKPVVLGGHFFVLQNNASGSQRLGFDAITTLNRLDYGVKRNPAVKAGGMLRDEAKIDIAGRGALHESARS